MDLFLRCVEAVHELELTKIFSTKCESSPSGKAAAFVGAMTLSGALV
jgi:hypothetical protein